MFPKRIIHQFERSVNYASFICTTPFYYDAKTRAVKVTRSKFKRLLVFYFLTALIVFVFVVLERLILIGKGQPPYTYEPVLLIIATICLIAISMPIILGVVFQIIPDEIAQVANLGLTFYRRIEVKYALREGKKRVEPDKQWVDHIEMLLKTVYYLALIHPSITQIFYYYLFLQPHRQILITSLAPFLEPSLPLAILLGGGIVVILQISWGIMLFAITASILLIFGLIFIMNEINPSTKSTYTVSTLREPAYSLFHYKCMQLINAYVNYGGANFFPPLFAIVLCITVICNVTLMLYGQDLHGPGIIAISTVSLATLAYQSVMYHKVGMLDNHSQAWKNSWKRCPNISVHDRKLMVKYHVASCRNVSFEVGHWGKIRTLTSLKIVGKIIFYTGKILLTLRKAFMH